MDANDNANVNVNKASQGKALAYQNLPCICVVDHRMNITGKDCKTTILIIQKKRNYPPK